MIEKLMRNPKLYLTEEDEQFANPADYIQLRSRYERYYPEIFAHPQLAERAKLYHLVDTLQLLVDWPNESELHDILQLYASRHSSAP